MNSDNLFTLINLKICILSKSIIAHNTNIIKLANITQTIMTIGGLVTNETKASLIIKSKTSGWACIK